MNKDTRLNLSMFMLRMVMGSIFVFHGSQKLFGMFAGMGLEGTMKVVEGFGFPSPMLFAVLWGAVEFISGLFLVFGMMSRWAALSILLVTLVRMWKINLVYGAFVRTGLVEYDIIILGSCLPLIFIGGGSWSVWDV